MKKGPPEQLGDVESTKHQEAQVPQSSAPAAPASNSGVSPCDCLAHRFGNAADHEHRTRRYPSDLTDAEWAVLRGALPVPRWMEGRGGRPESYCHRIMADAVLYLVDGGIKWRAMPGDFPHWRAVYRFFRRLMDQGLLTELHDRLRRRVRAAQGRDPEPTAGIIDSQSVKADAVVGAGTRGYDGGKKINGRKRHLVADCLGLLLAVLVTPASATDRDAAKQLLPALRTKFFRIQLVWADGSYTGALVEWAATALHLVLQVVTRPQDKVGFTVLPRRWVIERTNAWLMRTRRLARDYERTTASAEAMVRWSMTALMIRRLAGRSRGTGRPAP
jgi:transposase